MAGFASPGHYAFLWLAGEGSSQQTLEISAKNATGSATASYDWKQRRAASGRYQGFSSADVMYLITTDRFPMSW